MARAPGAEGWDAADWQYYQIESRIRDAMLLIAIDVGVFADRYLAEGVQARDGLTNDWEGLRGGRDPLQTDPLPDFGGGRRGRQFLGWSGGGISGSSGGDPALAELTEAIRSLIERVDALEQGQRPPTSPSRPAAGTFPTRGVDGGWVPAQLPGAAGLFRTGCRSNSPSPSPPAERV